MEFKDFHKKVRLKSGLSQAKMATKIGYSQSLIGSFEAGMRMPSFEYLVDLKEFCKEYKIKESFDVIFLKK